jgi:hypothetical protein
VPWAGGSLVAHGSRAAFPFLDAAAARIASHRMPRRMRTCVDGLLATSVHIQTYIYINI